MKYRSVKLLIIGLVVIGVGLASPQTGRTDGPPPSNAADFQIAAPQGFGDRQNGITWSMAWFKGKLYVGTARAPICTQTALEHKYSPLIPYPPEEADIVCAEDPADLPLRAEIWQWTPETGIWARVYQSPNDLPIPGEPGKFTARDIGYRGMLVFTESDGTEALYVGGVSYRFMYPGLPAPRILRTTDGTTFTPLPQDPGTFLHDTDAVGFRGFQQYKGRMFVLASSGFAGQGMVIDSADPKQGNSSFHNSIAMPTDVEAYEMEVYQNQLYIGSASKSVPFTVWKTDADGAPPYALSPVITNGGNRRQVPSKTIVSMQVFKDRLYIGTDRPPDLFRINPDGSWQVVVGDHYPMKPLSGMGTGFNWLLNIHMWRMTVYENRLYVGTMDTSTTYRNTQLGPDLEPYMGFDLYYTDDGEHFTMVTQTGLGSKFDVGVRQLVPTPAGLFLGDDNHYFGHNIWRAIAGMQPRVWLPMLPVVSGASDQAAPPQAPVISAGTLDAPTLLEAEANGNRAIVSWHGTAGAVRYRVYRADGRVDPALQRALPSSEGLLPGVFKEIATTTQPLFVDTTIHVGQKYRYYVVAENDDGNLSQTSNLAVFPSLASPTTFGSVQGMLNSSTQHAQPSATAEVNSMQATLKSAQSLASHGDLARASQQLVQLDQMLAQSSALEAWRISDLRGLVERLHDRTELASRGLIAPSALF